jgi:hypothetical protein
MPVIITAYNLAGQSVEIDSLVLSDSEVKAFNLRDYLGNDQSFFEGSLQITYQGKPMELGGVVHISKASESLMFDEELSETAKFASSKLEGIWAAPFNQSEMKLSVSNTTSSVISATISTDGKSPTFSNQINVTLQAHETKILSVSELAGHPINNLSNTGGISITHTGIKGSILARGLIQKSSIGYSNVIEFSDPMKFKSSKIDGVGLRVGNIGGSNLTQNVIARNLSLSTKIISGKILYETNTGSGEITIPQITLDSKEIKEINISSLLGNLNLSQVKTVGLHFEHNGLPQDFILSATSVTNNGTQVFRVPFRDASLGSSTGTYPFMLDGNMSAVVYLQNTALDIVRQYKIEIKFNGGSYVFGVKNLNAKQVISFDIRKIRDQQIPDIYGNKIPFNVTAGKFYWSIHNVNASSIIGRIEQIDTVSGMSMTSACGRCCPDSAVEAYLAPNPVGTIIGSQDQFLTYEIDEDCYGSPRIPYPIYSGVIYTSLTTPIATINSLTGMANALDVGTTTITAEFIGNGFINVAGEAANEEEGCSLYYVPFFLESEYNVAPVIKIFRNGQDITNSNQTVFAGEKIILSSTVTFGSGSSGTVTSHLWEVPEKKISNWLAQGTLGVVIELQSQDIDDPNVNFYWVNGGSKQITYKATVNGQQYSASVNFTVKSPKLKITETHNTVDIRTSSFQQLILGKGIPAQPGVRFIPSTDTGHEGAGFVQWVQLIHVERRAQDATTNNWLKIDKTGLDTSYPYGFENAQIFSMADSPNIFLISQNKKVQAKDTVQTWLMYKPIVQNIETIWIPVKLVKWNWCGKAEKIKNTWSLINKSLDSDSPVIEDTTQYPIWDFLFVATNSNNWEADVNATQIQCP